MFLKEDMYNEHKESPNGIDSPDVTAEPAQSGPILFLTGYWVVFQRQPNKTMSHAAEAHTQEKILASNVTGNQSFYASPVELID